MEQIHICVSCYGKDCNRKSNPFLYELMTTDNDYLSINLARFHMDLSLLYHAVI